MEGTPFYVFFAKKPQKRVKPKLHPHFLGTATGFAVISTATCATGGMIAGGKFMCRERHGIEHAAGAGILVGMALLIGHRVLGGVDQVLCGTNNANH